MSGELLDALEDRLEATSSEFRTMRNRVWEARVLLIVLGLLQIVLALFIHLSSPDPHDDSLRFGEGLSVVLSCLVGVGMVVASLVARRRPVDTMLAVLIGWGIVQCLLAVLDPLNLFRALLVKIGFVVVLARGLLAAQQAERIRRELSERAASSS